MTSAMMNGSGCADAASRPAAANAATARKTSADAAHEPREVASGSSRRPGAPAPAVRGAGLARAGQQPQRRGRRSRPRARRGSARAASRWPSSSALFQPSSVPTTSAASPPRDQPRSIDEAGATGGRRGGRPLTRPPAPPRTPRRRGSATPGATARRAGLGLVLGERHEDVQRVRAERRARRRSATGRPATARASGRSPRTPRPRRRSRSRAGASSGRRSRSGTARRRRCGSAAYRSASPPSATHGRSRSTIPHASFGYSARAWATIASAHGRGMRAVDGPGWAARVLASPPAHPALEVVLHLVERRGRTCRPRGTSSRRRGGARRSCRRPSAAPRAPPRPAPPRTTARRRSPSRDDELAERRHGVAVRDEVLRVEHRRVEDLGHEPVVERAQALDLLARQRLGGDDPDARLVLAAGSGPTPISVPPVPRPATNTSISGQSARISGPGRLVVGLRVGRVAVLVGHHVARVLGGQLASPARSPRSSPSAPGRVDDLRAEQLGQLASLRGDVVGHDERDPVALAARDHRERDAGVAGRRLEDDRVRARAAPRRSRSSMRYFADAVLDRPGRVRASRAWRSSRTAGLGRHPRDLDERRVADRVDDRRVPSRRRSLTARRARASGRRRRLSPPAIAGSSRTSSRVGHRRRELPSR